MIRHGHLPYLPSITRHSILFLTVVTAERRPCLACDEAFAVLNEVWALSPRLDGWFVGDFVIMPDHLHLFARPAFAAKSLASWIQTWKSLSSRRLTALRCGKGQLWQSDYFDRYLRSSESYREKWDYVAMNPVRKGLCERPEDWPWRGKLADL